MPAAIRRPVPCVNQPPWAWRAQSLALIGNTQAPRDVNPAQPHTCPCRQTETSQVFVSGSSAEGVSRKHLQETPGHLYRTSSYSISKEVAIPPLAEPGTSRRFLMEFLQFFMDFVLHVDEHLLELVTQYGTWIYLILFIIVFCETGLVVTPFLPGDSLLFAAGVLAGTGVMGYPQALIIFLLAGCLGDAVNYMIGRHVGPAIFRKDSRFIRRKYLLEAHAFYVHHGGKAIVIARFVPIVRTFAPFVAGIALMHPHTFFFYNITGCVLWVGLLVSAGYFLGNLEFVQRHFSLIVYGIILVSVLPVLIGMLKAKFGKGEKKAEPTEDDYMRVAASFERKQK